MMSLTFGLFTQVSGLGPLGPLVDYQIHVKINYLGIIKHQFIENESQKYQMMKEIGLRF